MSKQIDEKKLAADLNIRQKLPGGKGEVADIKLDIADNNEFIDRFDLTKERADVVKFVMTPVLQQPRRFGRDQPIVRIRQAAPIPDGGADLVDDRSRIVFLLGGREPGTGVEAQFGLLPIAALFLRFRDRRDQVGMAPSLNDAVGRLAVDEFPMARRVGIGRVQNRPLEELVGHSPFVPLIEPILPGWLLIGVRTSLN